MQSPSLDEHYPNNFIPEASVLCQKEEDEEECVCTGRGFLVIK
jgi:hypothetical protein